MQLQFNDIIVPFDGTLYPESQGVKGNEVGVAELQGQM